MITTLLLWAPVVTVGAFSAHAVINAMLLRRPPDRPAGPVTAPVSVLLPVRDEADRLQPCLRGLMAQRGVPRLEILVYDDASRDATAEVVRRTAAGDPRVRLLAGRDLPAGWLGKPHACHQLAAHVDPETEVLIFIDADVVPAPDAVAATAALLDGFDLVSPHPTIQAEGPGERLVQPLLAWSWLTFLPLRAMERSPRATLAAAGGQFLAVRRAAYQAAGGHAGVRDQILEDITLARAIKRAGGRITLADGSRLVRCRMYRSWPALVEGYTKSLWAAFGSPAGAATVALALLAGYTYPPLLALAGLVTRSPSWLCAGVAGYLLGVAGRVVAARTTGVRAWPDAWAQPISIVVFTWLLVRSFRHHRAGRLVWKGRPVG